MLTVARRRPSASLAWATWTSRWVSTPTVTRGRCSCAMVVMPSPFCDQAVDGTRRRAGGQHCNGSGATGSYQVTVARWRCPWRPQREPTGLATRHKASGTTGQTLATTTTARSLQWNKAILRTRKTSPGPVGVGTTYRQVRTVPSTSEEGFEVTGFEPPRRLEVHGDIGPFAATIGYLLAPMGDSTQLTNAVDLAPSSGALRLLAPLAAFRVKAAVAANLDTLTRILETGRPTAVGRG